jgi:ATP-dependent Lon protease
VELQVNLVVDNAEQKVSPIVVENHPTFKNLFGGIERGLDGAESDHTSA